MKNKLAVLAIFVLYVTALAIAYSLYKHPGYYLSYVDGRIIKLYKMVSPFVETWNVFFIAFALILAILVALFLVFAAGIYHFAI